MKKLTAALIAVAFVFIASSAMAAGAKVPKNLCFEEAGGPYYYNLVIKSMGTMATPEGKVKSYAITGHHAGSTDDWPITGSAYVSPAAPTILHATFDGQYALNLYYFGSFELFYDLIAKTGTLYWRYVFSETTDNTGTSTVNIIDCEDPAMSIPQGGRINSAPAQDRE